MITLVSNMLVVTTSLAGIDERALLAMLLMGAGASGAAWVLAGALRRRPPHRWSAWRDVARAAGLAPDERRLIAQLARRAGIGHPAAVLISRGCFDHAARHHDGRRSDPRLDLLRRRLFSA